MRRSLPWELNPKNLWRIFGFSIETDDPVSKKAMTEMGLLYVVVSRWTFAKGVGCDFCSGKTDGKEEWRGSGRGLVINTSISECSVKWSGSDSSSDDES
ncbi:hypothetical protein L6452_09532 [Arctium lappa]|uniref:Uncharacterized protein n=1 Tax=Arctium lappa TaxID=4217 RepID=A0ACB9DLB9_ARCLA|nr:hypothetical protein L6452_09532 [Arctium lappa]